MRDGEHVNLITFSRHPLSPSPPGNWNINYEIFSQHRLPNDLRRREVWECSRHLRLILELLLAICCLRKERVAKRCNGAGVTHIHIPYLGSKKKKMKKKDTSAIILSPDDFWDGEHTQYTHPFPCQRVMLLFRVEGLRMPSDASLSPFRL